MIDIRSGNNAYNREHVLVQKPVSLMNMEYSFGEPPNVIHYIN